MAPLDLPIYQFKITLLGTKPPIWRRLRVPGSLTLASLHRVIQAAMGWEDCHLHDFSVGGARYSDTLMADGWDEEIVEEGTVTLREVAGPGDRIDYWYDFGDDWRHRIVVEKIHPGEEGEAQILCTGGKRACPPEDCGGVWGYADLLATLADPGSPGYEELYEWAGELDPGFSTSQRSTNACGG